MRVGVKHLESGGLARWRAFAPALVLMAFTAASAMAQADAGTIHGHVRGAGGGVLINASVTATNTTTGVAATKLTDGDGAYSIGDLPPGSYEVSAALCA